jgi:hypothetical protein
MMAGGKIPPLPQRAHLEIPMHFKQLVVVSASVVVAACSPSNGREKGGGHGPGGGMPPSEVTVTTAT